MSSEENKFYVYIHRRNDNNEVFYVGKGTNKRATWKYGRSKWWQNIVDKAGGFTAEYVEKGLSEDDAFDLEVETIKFYKDCGHTLCNLTDGGEGASGSVCSEETKIKISESNKGISRNLGVKRSDETKRKMSKAKSGIKMPEHTKQKIAEAYRQRLALGQKPGDCLKKPIRCSNGLVFDSSSSAVNWLVSIGFLKAASSYLSVCCNKPRKSGKQRIAYGFSWEYIIEEEANLA